MQLYPRPSICWSLIDPAFVSDKRTLSIRRFPKRSFFSILMTILYPATVLWQNPVFNETCFSTSSKTVYLPPFVTIRSNKFASICFLSHAEKAPVSSPFALGHSCPNANGIHFSLSIFINIAGLIPPIFTLVLALSQNPITVIPSFLKSCEITKSTKFSNSIRRNLSGQNRKKCCRPWLWKRLSWEVPDQGLFLSLYR